jgi:hypothetical protein
MGRPSKLSDRQWETLGDRLFKGEKPADLAREYDVSKSAISTRFSKRSKTVKDVANQIVAAKDALDALSVSEQVSAISLAEQLRSISSHMAGGANYSAASYHRLAGMAHAKVQEIDVAAPMDDTSRASLKDALALQRFANEAASTPLNLLAANKDAVKQVHKEDPVLPVKIVIQVEDASVPEPEAQ